MAIDIDTDGDGKADFQARPEPFTSEYFTDVLTATTYSTATQMPTASRRFLNILPVTTIDTQPFLNDVLIIPVTLKDLGLSPGKGKLSYRAVTQAITKSGETSVYASFDVENPGAQPISGVSNTPVFDAATKPTVKLDAGKKLLVLHHTNIAGKRFEIVAPASSGNVALTGVASDTGATFTLENTAGDARKDVKVTVTATSGKLGDVTIDGAACAGGVCQLAELAVGAKATIAAKATAPATINALVSTGGCEPDVTDDTAQVALGAGGTAGAGGAGGKAGVGGKGGFAASPNAAAPTPDGPYSASGGCDCATANGGGSTTGLALALAGVCGLAARRRRRVA